MKGRGRGGGPPGGNGPGRGESGPEDEGSLDIEAALARALALGEQGEFEEMARQLAAHLEEEPDNPYLLGWLGVAEQELGNDGAAYDRFRACLAQDPLDPLLLAMAGAGLAQFDDPDAESALRAAALTGPDIPTTRLQYGAYLARNGMPDEALEHLRAARKLAPDDPTIRGELGAALAVKEDWSAATEELEAALDIAPDDEWTRVLLGLVHVEAGRLEDGATELLRATQEGADDPEAHLLAALSAAALGWEDAAYAALAHAEQTATGADRALTTEVEDRIASGPDAARELLLGSLAPSALRERLAHPL